MVWWKFWEQESGAGGSPDYYEEGVALVRQELYHDALTSFRLALRHGADDAATLEQMAVVYTHIDLPDDAIRAYREALRIRPKSTSAHYGLAFLLIKAGQPEGATEHLRFFLDNAVADREDPRQVDHAQRTLARLATAGDDEPAATPPD
jgi:Flp pilus assembly protein TadD